MNEMHPDDDLIDNYLNGHLSADLSAAFEVRLLEEPALFARVQLMEAMKTSLAEAGPLNGQQKAQVLAFGSWMQQPLSIAASVLVALLAWPAWQALSGVGVAASAPLGIGTVIVAEQTRGSDVLAVSGPPPYLLQFDAGLGNTADNFSVTLTAGNAELRGENLQADGDGWVRMVVTEPLAGRYAAVLSWNDAAGNAQRRQFTLELLP